MELRSILLDAQSPDDHWEQLERELDNAQLVGIDCETQDEDRHAGLNIYNNKKRHVFDHRRTVMTGFSLYVDGCENAWYINLAHADVENRVYPPRALALLDRIKCITVAHNAPFELVMFKQCHDADLQNLICTLQLAVTHHNPDEYPVHVFKREPLRGIRSIIPDIVNNFAGWDGNGRDLTADQQFVLGQFIAKESEATHSWNGHAKSISYGYGLKQLVKSIFGESMTTYDDLLARYGATHMGQLTGEQVCDYGADDAYWAVALYKYLSNDLLTNNPKAMVTFLEGENPMIGEYADAWRTGLRLNMDAVFQQRDAERARYAQVLRDIKATIRARLPFPEEPNQALLAAQDWYTKHWRKKRQEIADWALSEDSEDDFEQCTQVSNPIGNAWLQERNLAEKKGRLNLTHYYGMRTLLHDLFGHRLVRVKGDISTDKDARARMLKTFQKEEDQLGIEILDRITSMTEIEQVMKLYLTPYTLLMDPETGCVYPVLSSKLATRRMATSFPNPMQLAKRGQTRYVRGFYLPDNDDHVIISADWSSVELVEIGEFSGDAGFAQVFGQLPYGDLHSGATVDCLSVCDQWSWLTEEEFNDFKKGRNPANRDLRDFDGREREPADWAKFMRTEIGKGANFNYWYSGALGTVADRLGWTSDEMWKAVEQYRSRFAQAEKWRTDLIEFVSLYGYVELPDGQRRVRYEATAEWAQHMRYKFADECADPSVIAFSDLAIRRIQTRAGNQAVNAYIQGMCSRLAKDSILNLKTMANPDAYRFMMPIHDELVFSVHRDYVSEFIPILRSAMTTHPKYFQRLPLHCTVAVGRTFAPYDAKNPMMTQIELDEAPVIEGVIPEELRGKELPPEYVARVVDFICQREPLRLAA